MDVFSDLKPNSKTSVHLQIIQHARRKILNKNIIAYTSLPSRKELTSLLSISPNMVQKPYKLIEEEGTLRTVSSARNVVYVDEQIMECLQQRMVQGTVDDFIASCRECKLSFQEMVAILNTRWNIWSFIYKKCTT